MFFFERPSASFTTFTFFFLFPPPDYINNEYLKQEITNVFNDLILYLEAFRVNFDECIGNK